MLRSLLLGRILLKRRKIDLIGFLGMMVMLRSLLLGRILLKRKSEKEASASFLWNIEINIIS
jgi:hypothetical protein